MIRTGIGYDVHKLEKGTSLIIGGVQVPSELQSVGHSDGDSLIHSIIDSLLGAANLGDIGKYFPSEDEKWKDCSSGLFLKEIVKELTLNKYYIINIDSTIVLRKPKINPYIGEIKQNLALLMGTSENQISVKATTTDGLGYIGKSDGWSALAISTIAQK